MFRNTSLRVIVSSHPHVSTMHKSSVVPLRFCKEERCASNSGRGAPRALMLWRVA